MSTLESASLQERLRQLSPEQRQRLLRQLAQPEAANAPAKPPPSFDLFWLLARSSADPLVLHNANVYEVEGELDVDLVQRSFNFVLNQNDIYSWRAKQVGDALEIDRRESVNGTVVELKYSGEGGVEADFNRQLRELFGREFDVHQDLLLSACCMQAEGRFMIGYVVHHLISDGPTSNCFWHQFQQTYDALSRGAEPPATPANAQYTAYAQRMQRRLTGPYLDSLRAYWVKQLSGANHRLELAPDFSKKGDACEYLIEFPSELLRQVKNFALVSACTPYAVTLSAFYALLNRYTNQSDISIGAPVSLRPHPEDELVHGCTLNMICLRNQVDAQQPFRQLVKATSRVIEAGIQHADFPYVQLIDSHDAGEVYGQFEAYFQYRSFRDEPTPINGCQVKRHLIPAMATNTPLAIELHPMEGQPMMSVRVDPQRFSAETAHRIGRHYLNLLSAAIHEPAKPIDQQPLMDHAERAQWREDTQPPAVDYPQCDLVSALTNAPHAAGLSAALQWRDESITYADLWHRVEPLAGSLLAMGVAPGDRIGIYLNRSPDMLCAMLAVLKSGAAYVPLDPEYPAARIQYITEDADLKAVLVDGGLSWPGSAATPLWALDQLTTPAASEREFPSIRPDELAYIIYTSGSMGKPKGVAIEHRSVVNFLHSMAREPGLFNDSRLLALTTISFDISVLELFLPLLQGACLVLGDEQMQRDPAAIATCLERERITHFQATPTTWSMLLESGWSGTAGLTAMCGGEAMTESLLRSLADRCTQLWNLYGPTETTVWSSAKLMRAGGPVTIGRPIANTQIYVINPQRQILPHGLTGEICIAGDGLARGYWCRPELTADRFIELDIDGNATRVYRTGDLGMYAPDGQLVCLGRMDNQVKIRGHRIELDEIENAVQQLPGLERSVVILQGEAGQEQLAVYYVGAESSPNAKAWMASLAQTLPAVMVPAHWLPMDELPRTPSGKIDRKALSTRPLAAPVRTTEVVAPGTDLEAQLLAIWCELFPQATIGCTDDFFLLGGNSLSAIRLLTKVQQRCGFSVTYRILFECRTIRRLAQVLEKRMDGPGSASATENIITLRTGRQPGLVLVHGMQGGLSFYDDLVSRIGGDFAIHGIANPVEYRKAGSFASMADMADAYARQLMASDIEPPYRLLGYSLGGYFAFAVACHLQELGEPVAHLIMVEAFPYNLPLWLRAPASLRFRAVKLWRRLRESKVPAREASASSEGPAAPARMPIVTPKSVEYYAQLRRTYYPMPTALPSTLIRSRRNHMNLPMVWRYLTKNQCRVITLESGEHYELLDHDRDRPLYQIINEIWQAEMDKGA